MAKKEKEIFYYEQICFMREANMKFIDQIPKPLLEDFLCGRVIPFVGAGFSKNADIPTDITMPD